MAEHRSWDDFDVWYPSDGQITRADRGRPSDEDGIDQRRDVNAIAPEYVEFGLETAPNITWWKGIHAFTRENHDIGFIAMQDADHGPRWLRVRADALAGGRLEIAKAKLLGAHTGMYFLLFDEMPHRGGTIYTFRWHRD